MSYDSTPEIGRRQLLAALGVGVSTGLAGCLGDDDDDGNGNENGNGNGNGDGNGDGDSEFRVGLNSEPSTLDIHESGRIPEGVALAPIHETLFLLNSDIEPVPHLASDYEILDDARQFVFQLEEGVTFHNETELDAEQVIWNFERLVDLGAHASVFDPVTEMEASGTYEVTIETDQPYPLFLRELSEFEIGMAPRDAVEDAGDDWGREVIVGTGPYEFVEWAAADYVELERYDDYEWGPEFTSRPQSNVDRVVLDIIPEDATRANELTAGDLHADYETALGQAASIEDNSGTEVRRTQSTWTFLPVNTAKPPTDEIEVRRAIAHAINRGPLIDVGLDGEGETTKGFVPPFWANALPESENEELHPAYSPDAAREALDAAGWTNDEEGETRARDGEELRLNHYSFPFPLLSNQAEAIQAMLSEVGIATDLQVPEASTFYAELENNEHHLANSGGAFTPFASSVLSDYYHSSQKTSEVGGLNFGNYENSEVDDLIGQAQFDPDPEARVEAALEAQRILHQDLPAIPLNLLNRIYAFKDGVQGVDEWTEHPLWWGQYHLHLREVGL
jgi:peptide/nickel transport system substrate-binding protein